MKIKFLGTGGAFENEFGNSSAFITLDNENILLDCGYAVYPVLKEKSLIEQLDAVIITHLHNDHVGSLSNLIFHHHFFVPNKRLKFYYPTEDYRNHVIEFLSFSLGKPEKYVDFLSMSEHPNLNFIDTFGMHVPEMHTFAYIIENKTEMLIYSGDLNNPKVIFDFLEEKKSVKKVTIFHEISYNDFGAHTYYKDLIPFLEKYQIFAYHCNPEKNPNDNPISLVAHQKELML